MWLQFSGSGQLTSVSASLSGVTSYFNDLDDVEARQHIRDTLGTLRSSAERVVEASKQLATETQKYWEATRSFGKLAARDVKRQGQILGVAAEEDYGAYLFKVWTTHDPDPDRIPQAVEATLQGIQDGFRASDLSATLGMERLSAHATGNISAFDGIDELDTTIRDLSGIIAMKAVLIDAGTCGGPTGSTTAGSPTNEAEVKDYLKSHTDKGKNPPNRQVATDEEMVQLYNELTNNGTSIDPGTYPGRVSRLSDGTELRMRDDSLSGGRTIDIKYPSGKVWKVHLPKS